jgi:hypothetical protein
VETGSPAALLGMSHRFTLDGNAALEARLQSLCEKTREQILSIIPKPAVAALVLGGGYGRGEGGVLREGGEEKPYNDLEFYILLNGSALIASRRYAPLIHEAAEQLTAEAGIEVEFKLLGLRQLNKSGVTMFYYDLVSGHRLLFGPETWLEGCEHHRAAHRIPLHEATRLLMNRCSGLLFAGERLQRRRFEASDADFVGRNLAKAKLAFGDVVLVMRGAYHWSCRERHKRLRKLHPPAGLPNFDSILPLHEQGVEFKLHPVRGGRSREELQHELVFLKGIARDLWLDLESRRLGRTFAGPLDYSLDGNSKCPETNVIKNFLINLRRFRSPGLRYPRERLLRALPILLWDDLETGTGHSHFVQKELLTDSSDYSGLTAAYEALWKQYN